jgi:dolichol-phosphate mannosyltransferase
MYNEITGAEACVKRILAIIPALTVPAGLIVVDDGSNDGTGSLLDGLREQNDSFVVIHKTNGGYGHALRAGAELAASVGFDYLLFMDSDLTNPPEHIGRFIPPILGEGLDLVKASRFSHGGDMHAVPWRRRIFSVAGNLLARPLFRMGIADCTNGFRAIRASLFLRMPLQERGFAIILEELYWAKRFGATVGAVSSSLSARTETQRTSLFVYRPRVIWQYLKYALRAALVPYPQARVARVECQRQSDT